MNKSEKAAEQQKKAEALTSLLRQGICPKCGCTTWIKKEVHQEQSEAERYSACSSFDGYTRTCAQCSYEDPIWKQDSGGKIIYRSAKSGK
jgi:predicted nucleic-acid-binding Zn-ribbon protein